MRTVEENYEGVVIGGRRVTNLRYADDTTLLASTQESGNFSKIWYKKVHATTCISMHRCHKIEHSGEERYRSGGLLSPTLIEEG